MSTMTNANSTLLAALLADARVGTFTGLITQKQGTVKGGVRYDDDMVHTVIFTGFKYDRLVQRSLEALQGITDQDIVDEAARTIVGTDPTTGEPVRGLTDAKTGAAVSLDDVAKARAELVESFQTSLDPDAESTSTTAHVYEALVLNGETVRGGRVYRCMKSEGIKCFCRDCTGDAKAPKDGTIYIQGLQVFTKVLEAAPNGKAPKPKSAAKTHAKNLLRKRLPVSRYVSYRLEPGDQWLLRAGGTAAMEAQKSGFLVNDDILAVVAKAA